MLNDDIGHFNLNATDVTVVTRMQNSSGEFW